MPKQVTIEVGCYSSPKLNTTPSISLEYSVDLLTSFANCTEMDLIFGLNALLRTSDNIWNSSNARSLIKYCESEQYHISWELGNGTTKEKPLCFTEEQDASLVSLLFDLNYPLQVISKSIVTSQVGLSTDLHVWRIDQQWVDFETACHGYPTSCMMDNKVPLNLTIVLISNTKKTSPVPLSCILWPQFPMRIRAPVTLKTSHGQKYTSS